MTQLSERQLSIMRLRMPSFAEMEAKRIRADENAEKAKRIAQGIEPLNDPAVPAPSAAS